MTTIDERTSVGDGRTRKNNEQDNDEGITDREDLYISWKIHLKRKRKLWDLESLRFTCKLRESRAIFYYSAISFRLLRTRSTNECNAKRIRGDSPEERGFRGNFLPRTVLKYSKKSESNEEKGWTGWLHLISKGDDSEEATIERICLLCHNKGERDFILKDTPDPSFHITPSAFYPVTVTQIPVVPSMPLNSTSGHVDGIAKICRNNKTIRICVIEIDTWFESTRFVLG